MELIAERLPLFRDERLLKPVYAHQKFLIHEGGFKELKIHVPTAGGKTLGAVLFALRETFVRPTTPVRMILIYPTNLLTRNQFEQSIVSALTLWIGAEFIAAGVIDPVHKRFVRNNVGFEATLGRGVPTYIFKLPARLGSRDLYVTVITGEGLQYLLSKENIIQLGHRKGTYLLSVLAVLNQHDHFILCSPDLLGYVAQRCYSVTGTFYNKRWKDELELKLINHQVAVDEYHFYDPYTYLNLVHTLERLESTQLLLLSATGKAAYFPGSDVFDCRSVSAQTDDARIASYPIEVLLHRGEIPRPEIRDESRTIYFYHSVISAHEIAESLRGGRVSVTEWTGIRKTLDPYAQLTVATSAAEVGLDLPFRVCHTEFWGNVWEVPSLIQRIGRVGRCEEAGRSQAHVWITGREPDLLFEVFKDRSELSKADFSNSLFSAFGEEALRPEDYVSYYLWDEPRTQALRRFWQTPPEVRRLRFHFRPPNAQAVFDWTGTRFVYDWIPIANRYELEQVRAVTELPFWHEMHYSEWKVGRPLEKRQYLKRYEGKKDKEHRRCFWASADE